MNRKEYLETATDVICKQRHDVHGAAENAFQLISQYWSDFLSKSTGHFIVVNAADVAMMMTLFKIARWQMNPKHADNVVDGIGYLALAGELQDNAECMKQKDS